MLNETHDHHIEWPSPDAADRVSTFLHRLINQLAMRGVFLTYTDHLSDESLFELLVEVVANQTPPGIVPIQQGRFTLLPCLDFDRDLDTFLAVYADDAFRERWAESWPDDGLPPRRPPVAARDAFLPTLVSRKSARAA